MPLSFDPEVDFGLLALSLAFLRNLTLAELDRLTRGLPDTGDFASLGWRYIIEVMNATPDEFGASLRRTKPEQWEALMGTAAQAWLEQGKAEGKAEGQAELLLHMLERRFGPVPPAAVERIRAGTVDEITAWADAVLDAPSLEAVLDRGGR